MEKRAILAAVLMAGLLMLYQVLFIKAPTPQTPPSVSERPVSSPGVSASTGSSGAPQVAPVPVARQAAPVIPARTALVETPLYRAVVDSRGGRLEAWDLHYRGEKAMVVRGDLGPGGLLVSRGSAPPEVVAFELSAEALTLGKDRPQGEIKLTGEDGYGLHITDVLQFRADSYVVEHGITVQNRHNVAQSAVISMRWRAPVEWPKETTQKFQGQHPIRTVRLVGGSVQREDLAKVSVFQGVGQWVGLESDWYLTAYIPMSRQFEIVERKYTESRADAPKPPEVGEVGVQTTLPALEPGQAWKGRVATYVGPKEYERLKTLDVGLEKSIYFGGFPLPQAYGGLPMEWLAVPILWLMHLFYSHIGNYGVAIILLTVLTKVLFFPLTIKSMTSMKAMQALQPQLNAIRSKYKSDAQRMQQETMALYKANKVNPLGGCLPMVVQIPIFYALYVALSVSVELQNQPFICFGRLFGADLWICDLAAYDPTYVLPLLMGASMFVQQKMTPVMGDPRQAKMMLFMPILFTFMFLNLPSGLVLYWTLSNVLQIGQQKYMERIAKAEKVAPRPSKKG